jgi:predicted transcriptional regulator
MRKATKLENRTNSSFAAVANQYSKSYYFKHGDFIRLVADLRNVLVHEKKQPSEELATPAERIVKRLEEIANELESPEQVEARIAPNDVATLSSEDSIEHILKLIKEKQFSQFPVIAEGKIIGLLTENGITRWLSSEVTKESIIDFADAKVAEVLAHEEKRDNMILIGRLREMNEIRMRFAENPFLEAAIITQSGKPDQKPLGILTRWDFIET